MTVIILYDSFGCGCQILKSYGASGLAAHLHFGVRTGFATVIVRFVILFRVLMAEAKRCISKPKSKLK
jgi:hypothetical protein